jgi:16S rRNA (adenine1518-N6/adenine1519-N6)-dimethyltransferase
LTKTDLALEIGCGTGSLTARLAELAGAVVGVELDPPLYRMVRELMDKFTHVRIFNLDALRNKNELNPGIGAALADLQVQHNCTQFKLVANLPYAVATPVIANLLLSNQIPERMVVTIQWEVAERLTAAPNTEQFGAVSVLMQSLAEVAIIRKLPPSVFWPRPKVDSAIVMIRPDPAKFAEVGDPKSFRAFLRDLYVHKRKTLRSALAGWPTGRRDKAWVDDLLRKLDLPGTIRAEELNWKEHLRLWRGFMESSS